MISRQNRRRLAAGLECYSFYNVLCKTFLENILNFFTFSIDKIHFIMYNVNIR